MDYQRYLQLLQNQSQGQGNNFDMNSPQSRAQAESLRSFISPKQGLTDGLIDVAKGLAIGGLRSSGSSMFREYGKSLQMPTEELQMASEGRANAMSMLQKVEQARQERLMMQQKMAQGMAEHETDSSERKRHNDMMGSYYNILGEKARHDMNRQSKLSREDIAAEKMDSDYKRLAEKGLMTAVPLSAYDSNQRTILLKDAKDKADKGPLYEKSIKDIEEMEELVKKYPVISSNASRLFNTDAKGVTRDLWRAYQTPENQYALDRFDKLNSDMLKNDLKGAPGIRPTDMMKRIYQSSNPKTGMSKKAILNILEESKNHNIPYLELAKAKQKSIGGRYYIPDDDFLYKADEEITPAEASAKTNGNVITIKMPDGSIASIPADTTTEADLQKLRGMGAKIE